MPAVSAVPAAATVLAVPEVQHNPETLPTADAADAADAAGALLGAGIPLSRGRALSEGELRLQAHGRNAHSPSSARSTLCSATFLVAHAVRAKLTQGQYSGEGGMGRIMEVPKLGW